MTRFGRSFSNIRIGSYTARIFGLMEGGTAESAAHAWETTYALDWRYFATDDTFDYRGHTVEGLNLPLPVLKKLYHDNAVRWIPRSDPGPR